MTDTFNYWESELSGLKTTGQDDPVKLKLQTQHTETKWLSLKPEEFEALETFLTGLYAARLEREEALVLTDNPELWNYDVPGYSWGYCPNADTHNGEEHFRRDSTGYCLSCAYYTRHGNTFPHS